MTLVALPILWPLLLAGAALLAGRRLRASRTVGLLGSVGMTVASGALLAVVASDGPQVVDVGGWGLPVGITLVADLLACLILVVSALVVLATHVHAVLASEVEEQWPHYHTAHLVLAAGVALSLLTGDLFTLFVGFEVSLVASYVLLMGPAAGRTLRAARPYVIANVVVSTLFLVAVAATYATAGTVNLTLLAEVWPTLGASGDAIGLLLLTVFATKAAAFPFLGWLPDAYARASVPVAALLAGLLTKLGVYAMVRGESLLGLVPDGLGWLLPVLAGTTMFAGVVGALAQTDIRRILGFHITSQIGYMLFGLALSTAAGLAATVFYVVHHILVKSALFLVAGTVEQRLGSGRLERTGGLMTSTPLLAAAFAVPALSLAGIPPLSGFTAKVAVLRAGLDADAVLLVAVGTVVSLLTILSMAKVWAGAFWGDQPDPASEGAVQAPTTTAGFSPRAVAGTGVLVAGTLVVSLAAGPVLELSTRAADQLVDPIGLTEGGR